jgi:hypothetical protein
LTSTFITASAEVISLNEGRALPTNRRCVRNCGPTAAADVPAEAVWELDAAAETLYANVEAGPTGQVLRKPHNEDIASAGAKARTVKARE